jgi:hypothetical protein
VRGQELLNTVIAAIQQHFDDDVADAIQSDPDTVERMARHLNHLAGGDPAGMSRALENVAGQLDDATAEWLVTQADNPAAYVFSKL